MLAAGDTPEIILEGYPWLSGRTFGPASSTPAGLIVSFPDPTIIPVGELQRDLEAAFENHLLLDPHFEIRNLATDSRP
jgi:hypothetical protein